MLCYPIYYTVSPIEGVSCKKHCVWAELYISNSWALFPLDSPFN